MSSLRDRIAQSQGLTCAAIHNGERCIHAPHDTNKTLCLTASGVTFGFRSTTEPVWLRRVREGQTSLVRDMTKAA